MNCPGLLASFMPGPEKTMQRQLKPSGESVFEDPLRQFPRLESAVCGTEQHLLRRGVRVVRQEFFRPEVVSATLDHEFYLVLWSKMGQVL